MKKVIITLLFLVASVYAKEKLILKGNVFVDGKPATLNTKITNNSLIETKGKDSSIKFSLKKNAFLIRANSKVKLKAKDNGAIDTIRVFNGALLGVFKKANKTIKTRTVTAGLRGTGVYVRADDSTLR